MAEFDDAWNAKYRRMIERLEREMGREICGVPTSSGLPCKEWPISSSHGRCYRHQPEPVESSPRADVPDPRTGSDPHTTSSGSFYSRLVSGLFGRAMLIGLLLAALGMGVFVGTAVTRQGPLLPRWDWQPDPVPETNASTDSSKAPAPRNVSQPEPSPLSNLNLQDPDFSRLSSYLRREGEFEPVLSSLQTIIESSSKPPVRAEATYRKYVLFQLQGAFEESLKTADQFLRQFKDHPRRSEILFGAGWICKNYLEEPERARRYFRRLKDQYPQSKWANIASSHT